MPELSTIYDYMRCHAAPLGERILQEYPALHQFDDPVSPRIAELLRKPFPAQTIALIRPKHLTPLTRRIPVNSSGLSQPLSADSSASRLERRIWRSANRKSCSTVMVGL